MCMGGMSSVHFISVLPVLIGVAVLRPRGIAVLTAVNSLGAALVWFDVDHSIL